MHDFKCTISNAGEGAPASAGDPLTEPLRPGGVGAATPYIAAAKSAANLLLHLVPVPVYIEFAPVEFHLGFSVEKSLPNRFIIYRLQYKFPRWVNKTPFTISFDGSETFTKVPCILKYGGNDEMIFRINKAPFTIYFYWS